MAGKNHTDCYKKLLLDFIAEPDPLFSMLQWLTQRMMELESQSKAGAPKGKHSTERKTRFSGTRVRRFDTRLGHHVPAGAEVTPRRLYPVLCHGEEEIRAGLNPGGPGGLHKRCFHKENRAFGQEHGDRGHLGGPGIGNQQKARWSRCGIFARNPWRRSIPLSGRMPCMRRSAATAGL